MEQELVQLKEHVALLTSNYQALVGALRERDNLVKGEFDRHSARMGRHRSDINGLSFLVIEF